MVEKQLLFGHPK